jgi:hypothetical protein
MSKLAAPTPRDSIYGLWEAQPFIDETEIPFFQSSNAASPLSMAFLFFQGLFAAANIFSSLKLVYIFSVNPYLGPLQVTTLVL